MSIPRLTEIMESITTIVSGTITLNGTAQRITADSIPCKYVLLYNPAGNNILQWGGSSVTTGHPGITADKDKKIEIDNVNKLYFKGTNLQNIGYAYFVQ